MFSSTLQARTIPGSLRDAVRQMTDASWGTTQLKYLSTPQRKPYTTPHARVNQAVTLYDIAARYVGIGNCDTYPSTQYIVSDSFAPCVPVVAMHGATQHHGPTTALAHCFSPFSLERLADNWDRIDASIVVVQKATQEKQNTYARMAVATLAKMGFQYVSYCVVPTAGLLGIVVRGDTILTYEQVSGAAAANAAQAGAG